MEEQEKSGESLLLEALNNTELIEKLDGEALKHWDNIIANILELQKLRQNNPNRGSWMPLIAILFMFMGPIDNLWGGIPKDIQSNT